MIAHVGPGVVASAFATDLDAQGLFFPAGHCEGIRLGGYLLQGGYGWNSKVVGPACESVLGLEVVTADGDTLYCDPDHHPDLYWAARGSGPGFFGVVTSFTLRLHRRPAVLGTCLYLYPVEVADEVFSWGRSISAEIDDRVELQILTSRNAPEVGPDEPDDRHRLAGVRRFGRRGRESACDPRHVPGDRPGDGQPSVHADDPGQLVCGGDGEIP